jgi:hypothetical protein
MPKTLSVPRPYVDEGNRNNYRFLLVVDSGGERATCDH